MYVWGWDCLVFKLACIQLMLGIYSAFKDCIFGGSIYCILKRRYFTCSKAATLRELATISELILFGGNTFDCNISSKEILTC